MTLAQALEDTRLREAQLRQHIMRSSEYGGRFERDMKRQILLLYISILLLLVLQGSFALGASIYLAWPYVLIATCSLLAIINCLLLLQTRSWLKHVNEDWIDPAEKGALDALRLKQEELEAKLQAAAAEKQHPYTPTP